jgi:hypothetical protein
MSEDRLPDDVIVAAEAIIAAASEALDNMDGDKAVMTLAAVAVSLIDGNMPNVAATKASATALGHHFNMYMTQAIAQREKEEALGEGEG